MKDEQLSSTEAWLLGPAWAAGVVLVLVAVSVMLLYWCLGHMAYFQIRRVLVVGDSARTNLVALKSQTAANLEGNFWHVNPHQAQKLFEQVPWVRRAIVHRQFPDTLRVQIEEQVPVAVWQGDVDEGYVNGFGEVFTADDTDVPDDLPVFKGGDDQSARIMSMYVALNQQLVKQQLAIEEIELSKGGLWRIEITPDVQIQLGRGSEQELQSRLQRFFEGFGQIFPEKPAREALQMIASADLRYQKGFSIQPRNGAAVTKAE